MPTPKTSRLMELKKSLPLLLAKVVLASLLQLVLYKVFGFFLVEYFLVSILHCPRNEVIFAKFSAFHGL